MQENKIDISGVESDLVSQGETYVDKIGVLSNRKVAISVSINEDLEKLGFSEQHLNDISIEIARYIIGNEGIALYGGDLRVGGFTNHFSELSNQYKKPNDKKLRFINYFVFPNTNYLTREVRIDFQSKQIGIKEIPTPKSISINKGEEYKPFDNINDRYVLCECLREMRTQMAKDCDARILVGGKINNYLGYMPGVIEEALYAILEKKPIYLVGGFGGATEKFIRLIKGENVVELSNDYQYNTDFLKKYKEFVSDKYEYFDYESIAQKVSHFNLEELSKLNKLSLEENEILFSTKNIHEILYLIMKGLRTI